MFERLRGFFSDICRDEKMMRRIYIGCTAAALLLSVGILVAIARGEGQRTARVDAPQPTTLPPPGSMVSTAPDEGEELPLTVEIDDAQATSLVKLALRGKLDTESLEVRFSKPDLLCISATVTREAARDYLKSEGQGTVAALLSLAPKTLTLELELGIAAGDGGLALDARSFSACGLSVSEYLPDSMLGMASDAITSALPDTSALKGIEVRDGSAVFELGL